MGVLDPMTLELNRDTSKQNKFVATQRSEYITLNSAHHECFQHWVPLTTSSLIHQNVIVVNSTRCSRTF